jgi:hypothetical protein
MSRSLTGILCLVAVSCGALTGCTSLGFNKSKPFGRNEQWEPEVTEEHGKPADWRSSPSSLRSESGRASAEDPLDKYIWSSESRDINRSLGGRL